MGRSRVNLIISLFAALVLVVSFAAPVRAAEVVDRIVAIVNGQMITLSEVNKNMKMFIQDSERSVAMSGNSQAMKEIQKKVLDRMVDDILLRDKAKSFKLNVTDQEVASFIRDFKKENRVTEDMLRQRLQQDEMTLKEYEEKVRMNIFRTRMLSLMVQRKVVVTDEEIQTYYNQHKDEFGGGGKTRLFLLVADTKQNIQDIRKKIVNKEVSFEAAAKQFSIGPNAADGGNLGEVNPKDLNPELSAAISGVKPGEVSQPFMLSGKQALAKLDVGSGAVGQPAPLEEVKDQIRRKIEEPKLDAMFDEYMKKLRSEAVLDIRM
jgi:peptidyl-prolyl cis-trans isomerase SurA